MIKFTDAEAVKSKEAARKAGAKVAEPAATPETIAPEDATNSARKMTAPKRKKSGAG